LGATLLWGLALVGLGGGCSEPSGDRGSKEAERAMTGPREVNVVIFLIDTLRADYVHAYGYDRETSPQMDALAAQGVLFEAAHAPSPWTLPTVTSMMLSQFLCEHRVLVDGQKIDADADPLAARLKRVGYATGSFFNNPYAGPMSGLDKGYDVCRSFRHQIKGPDVAPWLEEAGAGMFYVYVHNTEPHNPYLTPDRYIREFGDVSKAFKDWFKRLSGVYRALTRADYGKKQPLGTTDNTAEQQKAIAELDKIRGKVELMYAGSVLQADTNLGSVIDALKTQGLWEDTLVVVLADHGEEMGERGMWQHDQSVNEELVRVPLIIRFPGDVYAGTRVTEPVSLVDLMPTILDYLNRPALTHNMRGESLMPLIRGEASARTGAMRITSMRHNIKKYYRPNKEQRGDINIVVREGSWKGIWNVEVGTFELYDLSQDPGEREDLSASAGERADEMLRFAQAWLEACESGAAPGGEGGLEGVDAETLERLRTLGYVGDEVGEPGAAEDPEEE
jgi:arylsulfatase A-like enzyme